jgi:hypothetical protein
MWLVLMAAGTAQTPEPRRSLGGIMRLKLDYAQGVLQSLVLGDFATLERQAFALGRLTEEAEWKVLRTSEYARYSAEFLRATESLIEAARSRDAEGAALDYTTLTFKCLQCHKHVRGVRRAGLPPALLAPRMEERTGPTRLAER